MTKTIPALFAAALLIGGASISATPAHAQHGGAVAAGVLGGLAAGAIIGGAIANGPAYAAPPPGYYAPAPVYVQPRCRWVRQRVWDEWNGVWRMQRVQVCG